MASYLRLLCCVFGLLAVQEPPGATGVNFHLKKTKANDQATCGVLHCAEQVQPGNASSISSLTVYKQEASRHVTLTTLSRQNPSVNSTLDDFEVDGLWTPTKVEVKLSLFEKDDCRQALFSCQVRFTDEHGKERMSVSLARSEDVRRRAKRAPKFIGNPISIQRRNSGKRTFNRNWNSYKKGFGSKYGEFWLGNDKIHALTSRARTMLRVILEINEKTYFSDYDRFSIGDEKDNYRISIGKYVFGNAGAELVRLNNSMFTTIDRDNDKSDVVNCGQSWTGGWWYTNCGTSNLNGKWEDKYRGLLWGSMTTSVHQVTFSEMSILHV